MKNDLEILANTENLKNIYDIYEIYDLLLKCSHTLKFSNVKIDTTEVVHELLIKLNNLFTNDETKIIDGKYLIRVIRIINTETWREQREDDVSLDNDEEGFSNWIESQIVEDEPYSDEEKPWVVKYRDELKKIKQSSKLYEAEVKYLEMLEIYNLKEFAEEFKLDYLKIYNTHAQFTSRLNNFSECEYEKQTLRSEIIRLINKIDPTPIIKIIRQIPIHEKELIDMVGVKKLSEISKDLNLDIKYLSTTIKNIEIKIEKPHSNSNRYTDKLRIAINQYKYGKSNYNKLTPNEILFYELSAKDTRRGFKMFDLSRKDWLVIKQDVEYKLNFGTNKKINGVDKAIEKYELKQTR